MKLKPFQLFKRKIVFSILLTGMVFACNAPEDLIEEKNPSNAKVTILRKAEIENKKMLFTKISKMKQNFVNSKTVTSTAYNFSIDTNICKMVEVNGITTYTFAVTREQPNGFFENLVLKENNQGSYSAYLLQYNISEAEKEQLLNGVDIDLNNRINKIAITDTDFISNITSKVYYNPNACYDVTTVTVAGTLCAKGLHAYGDPECLLTGFEAATPPTTQFVYTEIDCPTSGGGGGTGTSNPELGGGTSPTGGGDLPEFGDSPCDKLKETTNNNKIKLKNLKELNQSPSFEGEKGLTFLKNNLGKHTSIPMNTSDENAIIVEYDQDPMDNIYIYGGAHTHPNSTYQIFSVSDVFILNSYYKTTISSLKSNVVFYMVGYGSKPSYAIKTNNINEFKAVLKNLKDNANGIDLTDKLKELDKELGASLGGNLAKGFLNFFNTNSFSLYETTDNFESWNEVKLDPNPNNPPIKNPC